MIVKCANCGKDIYITLHGWGYMYGGKYACTYKCMRALERGAKKMTDQEKKEVDEMIAQGKDKDEICAELGLSGQALGVYLAHKRRKTEPKPKPEPTPEAVLEDALANAEKAVSGADDALKAEVVRLMGDMVAILKRII